MLTANVLCIKKRKKRSYCISNTSDRIPPPTRDKRSVGATVTMMHITEDTPPDMLAGAMDLTVHLPTGRSVKMSVERSTPMMDLLVQITTTHHLQLSGYIIQALGMAPSAEHSDKILPYKPSTPIGALDTQHIKVIPKGRTLPVAKNALPGRQPFESTFRLKVHLPRNQLYVCRVSRNVHLEDIMKKVCDEKNLDPLKYECRHPGNLDEVLNPKHTLNDYQITEIHIVSKGTVSLTQAFSSSDIMALRKEEERKQMQAKTGGGVFNLIFKRGKNSMGSGSLSSENRSISPTHSDDSRSLTPPAIQQQILPKNPPQEKPKPPQRKRRPAPKPPQQVVEVRKISTDKPPSQISSDSNTLETQPNKVENGLTICHSRNSSDSSGYHEASVLSDNCNTTLPRRPKSTVINNDEENKLSGEHSRSIGNLSKCKSTSSLALAGRKKKAAPPPPPVLKSANSVTNIAKPSPVVASQPLLEEQTVKIQDVEKQPMISKSVENKVPVKTHILEEKVVESDLFKIEQQTETTINVSPKPLPRSRVQTRVDVDSVPKPKPRTKAPTMPLLLSSTPVECICTSQTEDANNISDDESKLDNREVIYNTNNTINDFVDFEIEESTQVITCEDYDKVDDIYDVFDDANETHNVRSDDNRKYDIHETNEAYTDASKPNEAYSDANKTNEDGDEEIADFYSSKPPEVVALIPKASSIINKSYNNKSKFDTFTRKRGFQIGSSLLYLDQTNDEETASLHSTDNESCKGKSSSETVSINSYHNSSDINDDNDDGMNNVDVKLFSGSLAKKVKKKRAVLHELLGIHDLDVAKKKPIRKNRSSTSLHSTDSVPDFINSNNMKKWDNQQELDDISFISDSISLRENWVVGDITDTESLSTAFTTQSPRGSIGSNQPPSYTPSPPPDDCRKNSCCSIINNNNNASVVEEFAKEIPKEKNSLQKVSSDVNDSGIDISMELKVEADLDIDWQYPLPSPPKAFRDSAPSSTTHTLNYDSRTIEDSVVTSPELFEKLKHVEDYQSEIASDITSVVSEEEKPMCNKLTLENLEKRKSLVYNRELATSLKYSDEKDESVMTKHLNVLNELENVIQNTKSSTLSRHNSNAKEASSVQSVDSNLPNFKITTYDDPKKKINIFEDDSVRSNERIAQVEPRKSLDSMSTEFKNLNTIRSNDRSGVGSSMENISFRKHSFDEDVFKRPKEYPKHKMNGIKSNYLLGKDSVARSESFTTDQNVWKASNPVKRSKSQVALNKYQEDARLKVTDEDNLSKSNSLYDLQSLGVIRMIQTKLNTPSNSTEELDRATTMKHESTNHKSEPHQNYNKPDLNATKPTVTNRGPPAINLSTWSERPKMHVSLKEDTDYKINKESSGSKFMINTNNNATNSSYTKMNARFEYSNNNNTHDQIVSNNVSIKINGSDPISTQNAAGNLIIKIGADSSAQNDNVSFRKPLGNINKIESKSRPHSIAFDSNFDISRVPIVRSVELKKPYKDNNQSNNRSITQLNSTNNNGFENGYKDGPVSFNTFADNKLVHNKFSETYRSSENLNSRTNESKRSSVYVGSDSSNKPVIRVSSFVQNTPVVRGFRDNNNRKTWVSSNTTATTYGTLPAKSAANKTLEDESYATNRNVPFSQSVLRKAESNKMCTSNNNNNNPMFGKVFLRNTPHRYNNDYRNSIGSFNCTNNNKSESEMIVQQQQQPPPPPPTMPKNCSFSNNKKSFQIESNPRDQMLSEIRNFGGKKGLKSIKA